jgi:hypothetical protein
VGKEFFGEEDLVKIPKNEGNPSEPNAPAKAPQSHNQPQSSKKS